MIRVGQKLTIYVPAKRASQVSAPKGEDPNFIYHRVQRGDTLWDIARLYPGVSSADIKRNNNLSSDRLIPGQTLKIKPKG
jgi:membrane-bound lytic murein transglycosylase D